MNLAADFFYDEVRDGFYIPGMIKRAWGAEMRILFEIDRICKKYDIPYFISEGTLLGAVREGNFIPWDDDIDVVMLRDSFSQFSKVVEDELPEGLKFSFGRAGLQNTSIYAGIGIFEMKFREEILHEFCEFPYPAIVDIFVQDDLAKDAELENARHEILKMLCVMIQNLEQGKEEEKTAQKKLKLIEKLLPTHFTKEEKLLPQLYRVFHQICQKYNGEGEEVAIIPYQLFHPEAKYPKAVFHGTETLSFCGNTFPVPKDYDIVLKGSFGDYRKVVKAGGDHVYPYYKKYEKKLRAILKDKWFFDYTFQEKDLERPRVENFREIAMKFLDSFVLKEEELEKVFSEGKYEAVLSALPFLQERAVMLGNAIEERKGEGTESVHLLESFCEALFQLHSSLTALLVYRDTAEGKENELEEKIEQSEKNLKQSTIVENSKEQLEGLRAILQNLRAALEKEIKRQVVFLPHSAKHFASIRPLIDALREREDTEVKLMPIPYFDRMGDGSLSEMHYEGENFPKEYPITDYRSYNFLAELPDCIVMNSPYDAFNPVWSVDPFFYSEKLKQYTNNLVYIPWFVTDEIDPQAEEDGKAFYNMRYYVTVPGVFHADYTLVQSEGMRKAYLEKISRFLEGKEDLEEKAGNTNRIQKEEALLTRKEVLEQMEKKILGAGSCLLGEKEGQGVKEVVEVLKQILFEKE